MSSQVISTIISTVTIEPTIVKKTYILEDDSISDDTPYGHLTTELFVLNLLSGTDGFPQILDFLIESPKYTIVMKNLGSPISQSSHPIELFVKILEKVAVLHSNMIVHCDLKPLNILIDSNENISIIDFSHSTLVSNYGTKEKWGIKMIDIEEPDTVFSSVIECTEQYSSPESYDKTVSKSQKHDIWSLGCVLYEMITGKRLFDFSPIHLQHADFSTIKQKIQQINDIKLQTLLRMMLVHDPEHRSTVNDLLFHLGIQSNPPRLFTISTDLKSYIQSNGRLRCYDFPPSLCRYVDQMIDHIKYKMSFNEEYKPYPYDESYDISPPQIKYHIYEIYIMVHTIIDNVFCIKERNIPWDVLCKGHEYMEMLWTIIKCYRMTMIF